MEPNTDNDRQTFVTEKIKEKPVNKRRLLIKVGTAALCGLVFALFTVLGLALGMPLLSRYRSAQEESSEADLSVNTEDLTEVQETEEMGTEFVEPIETESEENVPPEPVIVDMPPTLEDYQNLQNELYEIGRQAENSMVTITAVKNMTDWFNSSYAKKGSSSGVIISETEGEYLILIPELLAAEESRMIASLPGGLQLEASYVAGDANTGMSVVSVPKSEIDPGTMGRIAVAQLGNSNRVVSGQLVLAIGNLLNGNRSILIGSIASTYNEFSYPDGNYRVLTTDIICGADGSGILINREGEVLGLILPGKQESRVINIDALAISDTESMLRRLINGNSIPYLGLYLSNVTRSIADEYDIPMGVYVREVTMDSPAMLAGLQSGDVIQAIGATPVSTTAGFREQLLNCQEGDVLEITVQRPGQDGYEEIVSELTVGVMQ